MAKDDLSSFPMDKSEFFAWCESRGLIRSQDISAAFRVSSQTIRNWQKKPEGAELAPWVRYACIAIEGVEHALVPPESIATITVSRLSDWQIRHGFRTLEDTANIFSVTRQAVHNWYKRQSFPEWLSMACTGYDIVEVSKDSSVKSLKKTPMLQTFIDWLRRTT